MKKRQIALPTLLLFIFLVAGHQGDTAAAPAQQGTNILTNPSFEQPYVDGTAQNWNRWHQETAKTDAGCEGGYHYKPKWLIETNGELVADGVTSQKVGNTWDTWHGGVFQTVDVTPGETYRFTVLARGRASNDNYPQPSEFGVNMNVQVGIDPNGSGVWHDADVVWGATGSPHDAWQSFTVEAAATGDKMSVFTSANFGVPGVNQCRKFMDVWFDQALLVSVGPPPTNTPPPPPPATAVPAATVTPLPSPTSETPPTEMPPPTQESSESSPPADLSSGGTICVNAFDDVNANGRRDGNEGFMPGVTFTVASSNAVAIQAVSEGAESPRCVGGLEPGLYQVAQEVPDRLQMTTAANTTVEALTGSTTVVVFGSRSRSGEPVATAPSESSGEAVAEGGEPETNEDESPPQPTSGGMICVNAFHDENSNGVHDSNEGYMGGVTLVVSGEGGVAGQTISEGSAAPYCIDSLQPGAYDVEQQVPNRVVSTTADNALVALAIGKTINVEFGSRLDVENGGSDQTGGNGTSSEAVEPEAEAGDGGPDLLVLGGLGVIVLVVILLGALLFFFLRR